LRPAGCRPVSCGWRPCSQPRASHWWDWPSPVAASSRSSANGTTGGGRRRAPRYRRRPRS
jgi:hypothetical protein